METAIHIVLLVLKVIVAWYLSEMANLPIKETKDRYMEKIITNKMRGKSTMPYLVAFGIKAVGCVAFLIIMIHITCEYLDIFEKYLLSLLK